jgi:activating signal cointegrator 1
MRGYQGVYNLQRRVTLLFWLTLSNTCYSHLDFLLTISYCFLCMSKIYDGAVRGLSLVQGPQPVKFPLPDPRDPFSLKPGSLTFDPSKTSVQKTASVTAAIAGARAAATQFSRKDNNSATSRETQQFRGNCIDSSSGYGSPSSIAQGSPSYLQNQNQPFPSQSTPSYLCNLNTEPRRSPRLQNGAPNRVSVNTLLTFI